MQQAKISVQDICCIALMAAVTVVMAQISIPMPMGVPMTMQTFAVTLAGVILGFKERWAFHLGLRITWSYWSSGICRF